MKYSKHNIQNFSNIGPRATFGLTCLDIVKNNKNLLVLAADVSTSAGLDRFRKQWNLNYIELGISEQNMMGVAAGLASNGFDVITTTFSPFQTLRCLEQIKVNLGYMKNKVCFVGLASGVVLGSLGYTHCSIEDIGVLRSIPNLAIVSPADSTEVTKVIPAALKYKQSVYVRLTGGNRNPIVNRQNYSFSIGKAIKLKDGKDITIFASGSMVYTSLIAAEELEKIKISCEVINMHTIKPIDQIQIRKSAKKNKLFVSIEEHNVIGGLGSSILEVISCIKNRPILLSLGLKDSYEISGEYNFILKKNGLDTKSIIKRIKKFYNSRK